MKIPFYIDSACPWAYLGSCRAESHFEDLGVALAPIAPEAPRPGTRVLLQAALLARDRGTFRAFHHPAHHTRRGEAKPLDDPAVVRHFIQKDG